MTANDSKSYLKYFNKLVDEYNNAYHRSIGKTLLMLIILVCLRKLRRMLMLLNLTLVIASEILITKIL